jgi:hypothetical protein
VHRQVGLRCDAREAESRGSGWYEAKVVEVDGDRVLVHFKGWSTKFDTWLPTTKVCVKRRIPMHCLCNISVVLFLTRPVSLA